jgi:hypothetical protein
MRIDLNEIINVVMASFFNEMVWSRVIPQMEFQFGFDKVDFGNLPRREKCTNVLRCVSSMGYLASDSPLDPGVK